MRVRGGRGFPWPAAGAISDFFGFFFFGNSAYFLLGTCFTSHGVRFIQDFLLVKFYLWPCYHALRHPPFGAADRAMLLN